MDTIEIAMEAAEAGMNVVLSKDGVVILSDAEMAEYMSRFIED